MLAGYRVTC